MSQRRPFGWDLPPGVRLKDVEGRQESQDEADERYWDEVDRCHEAAVDKELFKDER